MHLFYLAAQAFDGAFLNAIILNSDVVLLPDSFSVLMSIENCISSISEYGIFKEFLFAQQVNWRHNT